MTLEECVWVRVGTRVWETVAGNARRNVVASVARCIEPAVRSGLCAPVGARVGDSVWMNIRV